MIFVKKLTFAPLFLLAFGFLVYFINPLFSSYDFIFSLSWETFFKITTISGLLLLSSFLFVLFVSLSQDLRVTLPIGLLAAFLPVIFLTPPFGLILAIGSIVSFFVIYLTLDHSLKTYITFQPFSLFGPPIRNLLTFLIMAITIIYFLSANTIIQEKGFQIPDSLIEASLKFAQIPQQSEEEQSAAETPKLQISQEQLDLLRKNPDLLKQYGLDPKILDTLNQPKQSSKAQTTLGRDLIKQTVKDQLNKQIEPYLLFIPGLLAVLLFFTLQTFVSFFTLFIYPMLWLIFYILEKSGFVKFTTEMRPVKKMVI